MIRLVRKTLTGFFLVSVMAVFVAAQEAPSTGGAMDLPEDQQIDFLLHAKVTASKHTGKGVTNPWRLTLTDGKLTHDASFQPIDEVTPKMTFADGHTEFNFKDSYHYNIAGYKLAKLLGMDNMVPVYVERSWNGMKGSLSWWVPDVAMDEGERMQKKIPAPDPDAWNKQMYKIRVFDELIYDTDPNLTNVLVTKDWKIWRIDFSRAFRTNKNLQYPKNLVMCDKGLLAKIKQLDEDQVIDATQKQLSKSEVKALMARRDKIVAYFDKLVAEKGEGAVLY